MQLDELKNLIKLKLEEGTVAHTTSDLEAALRKSALSVNGKIKRSIWFELAACAVCMMISMLVWVLYASVYIHLFCAAAWLFCFAFSVYLYALYSKIVSYEIAGSPVKESLRQIIKIVTRFTRLDLRLTMGLLPVIFIFGIITGYLDVSQQGLLGQFRWSNGILFYSIAFVISWPAEIHLSTR